MERGPQGTDELREEIGLPIAPDPSFGEFAEGWWPPGYGRPNKTPETRPLLDDQFMREYGTGED